MQKQIVAQWTTSVLGIAILGFAVMIPRLGATPPERYERWQNGPSADPSFFPIAVWLQAPRNAAKYRQAGINTYVGLWNGPNEEQLEVLAREEMKIVCAQNDVALKSQYGSSIIAWMHGDEPDNAQTRKDGKGYDPPILPELIQRDYQRIRQRDPTRPVLLNLGQGVAYDQYVGRGTRRNHPEDYAQYIKGCDIASFDIYPVVHDKAEVAGKLEFVPLGVERLRSWARADQIVWNCIECSRISNREIKPSVDQIRSEVWMSIIKGSRGIIYFVHQFEPTFIEASVLQDSEMLAGITAINQQVQSLAAVIRAPEATEIFQVTPGKSSASLATSARQYEGAAYLFLANMDNQPVEVNVLYQGSAAADRVQALGESRSLAMNANAFSDTLLPYGVHLYQLPTLDSPTNPK